MAKKKRRMPPSWYSSRELLREADWLWWVGEYQMAWDIMHIIADRVTAAEPKEPRDGEMEREGEETGRPKTNLRPVKGDFVG